MFRNFLSRTRASRFISLICLLSLCANILLLSKPVHINKIVYRSQDLANLRIEDSPIATDELYKNVTNKIRQGTQDALPQSDTSSEAETAQSHPNPDTGGSGNTPSLENNTPCTLCPYYPPHLEGPLADMTQDMLPETLISYFPEMIKGRISPKSCTAREKLAIIIPYRNRYPHLHVFLHNIIPFLMRQQADATIFVIEQALPGTFNRGALLNVGFLEAEKLDMFDCFIFHDVDLIPLDDRHMYRCGDNPKHFAVAMNKYKFRLPYSYYFGGAVGFSKRQYLDINGCSNVYFGWGGEDDEMRERVVNSGYIITRAPMHIARYDMIKHKRDKGNEANPVRKRILATARKRQTIEGLNTIKYTVNSIRRDHLYTWINVSLNETEILLSAPPYVRQAMIEAHKTAPPALKKNTTATSQTVGKGSSFVTDDKGKTVATDNWKSNFATDNWKSNFSTDNWKSNFSTDKVKSVVSPDKVESVAALDNMESVVAPDKMESVIAPDKIESVVAPDKMESVVPPDKVESVVSPDNVELVAAPDKRESVVAPDKVESVVYPDNVKSVVAPDKGESVIAPDNGESVSPDNMELVVAHDKGESVVATNKVESNSDSKATANISQNFDKT